MNSRTNVRARGYSFRVASRLTLTERQPKRIVPVAIFSLLAVNMPRTSANGCWPRSCVSSRWAEAEHLGIVRYRLAAKIDPDKLRIALES
jgi:hypothetical protein